MMQYFLQITTHPVMTTVLTLLLLFQWDRQHAKEQSIKNNLFSIRRAIDRMTVGLDPSVIQEKAWDLIDSLDATLSTLGMRKPFRDRFYEVLLIVKKKFRRVEEKGLERLHNETDDAIQNFTHVRSSNKNGVRKNTKT